MDKQAYIKAQNQKDGNDSSYAYDPFWKTGSGTTISSGPASTKLETSLDDAGN
jgi:hypothetical protein